MDNQEYERLFISQGKTYIAGVDEVGRGPLAGPVVCAAVIMPQNDIIEGVTDSKKLSEKKREYLAEIIKEKALSYKICEIPPETIDEINILNAVKRCMENAVNGLKITPDVVIVDGLDTGLKLSAGKTFYLVKGDFKSYTVGCASIIAKVYRDDLMRRFAEVYPDYDFVKNKGYGTKAHIDAIKEKGPCPIHRKTFIKNFWGA